jgi:acyl-coenzyme A synthetase/AMP-(fatty) acid ligase
MRYRDLKLRSSFAALKNPLMCGGGLLVSSIKVNKLANVLLAKGVKKGDRVTIFMGHIPENCIAMLACARIGAVHSVVFGGFSKESLASRVVDCGANVVITQDGLMRGSKLVALKQIVDAAIPIIEAQGGHIDTTIGTNSSPSNIPQKHVQNRMHSFFSSFADGLLNAPSPHAV